MFTALQCGRMENIMKRNLKIALASPKIKLADPAHNVNLYAECAKAANENSADIIVFPELAITGATCMDLFCQELLISAAEEALADYIEMTEALSLISFIGLPISVEGILYNAVAAVCGGDILGITVSGLNARCFSPLSVSEFSANVAGKEVVLGRDLVFTENESGANIFIKIGDDGAFFAKGVDLVINPTAMTEFVGAKKKRREYAAHVTASSETSLAIVGAGIGESGTDGVYASPKIVASCGRIIAESELFDEEILYAEISKNQKSSLEYETSEDAISKFPFVPEDAEERREVCKLVFDIQSRALAERMRRAGSKCAVLGISGGLDSTQALLVAVRAADILEIDRKNIVAITMPCFGTTVKTKSNAISLAENLGASVRVIDIKAAINQHFSDISHDENNYNVVYENAQARERTQILMDVANGMGGLVIGTGDLSELALGFATYNGDHMSMYSVNGSLPKTLMRETIRYAANAAKDNGDEDTCRILLDVIDTPVSPELLPVDHKGENVQHTEKIVGPYELHDFFLYLTVKYGYRPSKIFDIAKSKFDEYTDEEIMKYLNVFVSKFYTQQFKRSCMPDGPRVTEISLSPRGSWQMPSDISPSLWKNDIKKQSVKSKL